ncbi:Scr1 family TA system antitoxin-like transcriptional regulator [Streptomyces sp. NBC_01343]|uniref:Scr1 family TA system antitoxin-like transcriptional regulator n=1 Tax=Streptomyces sp. NBC_01343 TaxID=2903832 RepID=UPI002E0E9D53
MSVGPGSRSRSPLLDRRTQRDGGVVHLIRFDGDPDLFHAESYGSGRVTANPQVIRERSGGYARLQAAALSPEESAHLIARVMGERCGGQCGPVERAVAQVVLQRHQRRRIL